MPQAKASVVTCECKVAHPGHPCPDVTLILGEYKWKVHSKKLISKSFFFWKALERQLYQKASSKTITLHDDDPWLIVRLIQFVNEDVFHLGYIDCNEDDPPENSLESFEKDMQHASTFQEDLDNDKLATNLDVVLGLFKIAEKYMMDTLIDAIGCKLGLIAEFEEGEKKDLLKQILSELSPHELCRTTFFRDQFVRFVVGDRKLIENAVLQQYCLLNPVLALEIARGYARG